MKLNSAMKHKEILAVLSKEKNNCQFTWVQFLKPFMLHLLIFKQAKFYKLLLSSLIE